MCDLRGIALVLLRDSAKYISHISLLGQKGRPLLSSLRGFKYEKFNLLEWMNNLDCVFDNFLELLVGTSDGSADRKARKTSQDLGLFPEVWSARVQYLSTPRTQALTRLQDENIARADSAW